MKVKGGFVLESGAFDLGGNALNIGRVVATSNKEALNAPLLEASVTHPAYTGPIIKVTTSSAERTSSIMSASTADGRAILEIAGDGSILSSGGATFSGPKGLTVANMSTLSGGLTLSQTVLAAGPVIEVVMGSSAFVTIIDDEKKSRNELRLPLKAQGAKAGQMLVISNADEHPTRGAFEIPSNSTVLLVFDGSQWVDVQALHAPITVKLIKHRHVWRFTVSLFAD
jgi:hypothetical protein